ncbi:MAG: glycosyltransferase family 39 protein [Anaerolineales bacterium]|nr:glycosyltransferase family 39 protein [Anaerolineales bacterium]
MTIESAVTLYSLVSIPSDVKNIAFLGFSSSRLLLMSGAAGVFLTALFLSILFFISSSNSSYMVEHLDIFFSNSNRQTILITVSVLCFGLGMLFLLTPAERFGEAFAQRILPVIIFAMLISMQILLGWFLWVEKKIYWFHLIQWKNPLLISAVVLTCFILLWSWIAWSSIGIKREPSGWLSPGTPILAQQLLFAWVIALVFILLGGKLDQYKRIDLIIGISLWLITCLVWLQEPMLRESYFTPEPTPPNFEYYPYSDAALYDGFAQNLLIGASRQIGVTHRPLYSLFLALLHAVGGYGFHNVLFMQVLILSFIPVVGYFLTSSLGGRPAGTLTAILFMFREKNSIALTNIIEVSHVKLIMSDVPTMLLILLFIYFYVKWLQNNENRLVIGVLAGAFFGLTVFIRSQAQLLVPIALLGFILTHKFIWKAFSQKSFVFLLSALVVVAPWVWRNYQLSGRMVVEYQGFYTRFIASSYSSSPNDFDRLPSETTEQYDARMKDQIINFILNNPLKVARFYTSYFLHNEITSVTYLPMSPQFYNINDYVDIQGFWDAPYLGEMPLRTLPALFIILCIIATGIGAAFHCHRWIGIMPLLFHLGYSLSVVPVKQSGWRFILPVDWVSILYFSLGLTQLSLLVFSLFSQKKEYQLVKPQEQILDQPVNWRWVIPVLATFAIFGVSLPMIERGIPERYSKLSDSELIQLHMPDGFVLGNGKGTSPSDLESFLETEAGSIVMRGRALYPAYYEQGEFWGESSPNLLEASQYDRLQFYLIAGRTLFIFLPVTETLLYFPHASDVFIIGCMQNSSVRALLVKVNDRIIIASPWRGLTCSIAE